MNLTEETKSALTRIHEATTLEELAEIDEGYAWSKKGTVGAAVEQVVSDRLRMKTEDLATALDPAQPEEACGDRE